MKTHLHRMPSAGGLLQSISLVFTRVSQSGVRGSDTQGVEAPRKLMFRIQQIKSKPLDIKSRETQGSEGKWIREITMHSLQERHIQLQKALQRTIISGWHIHQRCVGNISWIRKRKTEFCSAGS